MLTSFEWIALSILILIVLINISVILILFLRKPKNNFKEEITDSKFEIINSLNSTISTLGNLLNSSNEQFSKHQSEKIDLLITTLNSSMQQLNLSQSNTNREIEQKLENIRQSVEKSLASATNTTEVKLENIRSTIEKSLTKLQDENSKKLDEMRDIVDKKLQETLENRISKSFQLVSDRLEQVYKGLGEMQNLASGVGDLKKVLSNVKTRGILGEFQLANILEEILTPDQYETNIATKKGSRDRVEFAIKLPGDNTPVYLPIDAKFPLEDYQNLLNAYEDANQEQVKNAQKELSRKIKLFAKDISDKYIDVPNTTDFGIMFLPVEGLYAEVVKLGLIEELQKNYKINIAGPTTMAALLNSLQMGFRTLAIQKRTSEVWNVLAEVKTEFNNFGKALEDTQKRINQAGDELEKLVGTRTRMMQNKLKKVIEPIEYETTVLLPEKE